MSSERLFQTEESISDLPLLPLKDIVVFPHMIIPVFINEDLCINAVEESLASHRKIFLSAFNAAEKPEDSEIALESSLAPPFDVYDVGTVCSIMRTRKLPDGRMKVLVQGLYKATIVDLISVNDFPKVKIQSIPEETSSESPTDLEAMVRVVRENLEKVSSLGKVLSPDILMILEDVKDPGRLADLISANLGLKLVEAQKILVISNPIERLEQVHSILSREIEVYQMQVRIQTQAKEEIGKMQREHYLREQIRALKSELGDADSKDDIEEYWKTWNDVPLSSEASEEISRQIKRLERMHQDTSEATLTRTHIETVLGLPWGKETADNLDIRKVKKQLSKDHFGLDQVKERIIEYLAVKKLNPGARSPILCFVGPPGVGKTSLGRSIASAMNRKFSRISLGGVRDEADIRGHRKTYVGAFPGRIINSIKTSESSNPIIMLDEIDKLGSDHRGDPAAALLEVLDPEQNFRFVDHYIGVSFDLSKVMFVANANSLDSVSKALRDRLEVIEVSGYSEDEKMEIANRFLMPKQAKEVGLGADRLNMSKSAMKCIIRDYTRESGLRSLEKNIASVCRKVALGVAESDDIELVRKNSVRLTPAKIQKFLGAKRFGSSFSFAEAAPGVSLGMAYTQSGGEVLAIETSVLHGDRKLVLTGYLGEVMKESAMAALGYVRSRSQEFLVDKTVLEKSELHVHLPQGAVPKDGPSAGVALVTSMLSALLGQAPTSKVCMTGEITLHGKVLPVGGIKEKVLAAQREGMDQVILPETNRSNYMEIDLNVRKKLKVHFVSNYEEVFPLLFKDVKNIFNRSHGYRSEQKLGVDLAG